MNPFTERIGLASAAATGSWGLNGSLRDIGGVVTATQASTRGRGSDGTVTTAETVTRSSDEGGNDTAGLSLITAREVAVSVVVSTAVSTAVSAARLSEVTS